MAKKMKVKTSSYMILIDKLKVYRPDLSTAVIINQIDRLRQSSPMAAHELLGICCDKATRGEPLLWDLD